MKLTHLTALLAGVAVVAFASGAAFTEDKPKPKPLTVAEVEAKMFQMGSPGAEHELLKRFIGTWVNEGVAYTESMGEFPIRGETTFKSIMGGRFLAADYKGPPGPMGLIVGTGHMGFDRMAGEFVSTWMMSMGTGIETYRGSWDAATKTLTMHGTKKLPGGNAWPIRQAITFESADKVIETHYMTPASTGKEQISAKMSYTRKAAKPTTGK
ncbi:MAG: DUF1579 family protein [Planctomycetota bacterium]|nr:DUF1579 family protein [Planctomycetota bacterium]